MDYIHLKNRVEKSETRDGVTKTLICGEVENGYVVIKKKMYMPEYGMDEMSESKEPEEEIYIFKENPFGEKKEMSLEDGVKSLIDEYM